MSMHFRPSLSCAAALLAGALVSLPNDALAQQRPPRTRGVTIITHDSQRSTRLPDRDISLVVGVFDYDRGDDDLSPMAGLRAEWRVARWVRAEVGGSYAIANVDRPDLGAGEDANTNLFHASVGVKAELPNPVIRPYVGAAIGLFGRFDSDDGQEFVRPSLAVPVGIRIPVGDRINLRGEARFRFDEHLDGRSVPSREFTVGFGVRY